ncbi:MAG TPA: ABC transporter substrate-binding protein [Gemmatimonadaceae bacterium]|nr:ABC transporter substrate-binding protein [Gemmatimonadaceae bacterium]
MRLLLTTLQRGAKRSLAAAALAAAACENAGRGGTLIIASGQDPQNLFPPTTDRVVARAVTELLFDKLADVGPALNTIGAAGFQPRLARSWDWSRDSLGVTFHLDPRARWQDGHAVRAADVRFALDVYTDTLVGSRSGADLRSRIDSISVGDSLTCTVWFKERTPENFYNLVNTLIPLPVHLLGRTPRDSLERSDFARAPVGNGPFRFVRWEPLQRVEIVATESFYRGRAKLDRVIWTIAPVMTTLVQQLFAGEADFMDELPPADLPAAAGNPDLRIVRRASYGYGFLQFNLHDNERSAAHRLFGDRELRRALTRALDRATIVRSVFDSLGVVARGPFVRAQWAADTTVAQLGFDRAAAVRTLDSLGWRVGSDGIRSRAGIPLEFTVIVSTASKNRTRLAPLVQEQWRQAGIRVDLQSLDDNAFNERRRSRRFDALLNGLATTPSPSGIRQSWTSSGAKEGGFNAGRYENAVFDAEVDSGLAAGAPRAAKAHFRAAYQIIADDAPAIFLYEPVTVAAMSRRLETGPLRGDAWWSGIPAWSIVANERRRRDSTFSRSP